jgi:hypothetical protein
MTTPAYPSVTDELLAAIDVQMMFPSGADGVNNRVWRALRDELRRLRAENEELARDAGRYRWLQRYMGSNVKEGWDVVCQLGGVCSWVGWDAMDQYLDDLPACNVGLCTPAKC